MQSAKCKMKVRFAPYLYHCRRQSLNFAFYIFNFAFFVKDNIKIALA